MPSLRTRIKRTNPVAIGLVAVLIVALIAFVLMLFSSSGGGASASDGRVSVSGGRVSVSDPSDFLDRRGTTGGSSRSDRSIVMEDDRDFLEDVQAYVDHLERKSGLELTYSTEEPMEMFGREYLARYTFEGSGSNEVIVEYYEDSGNYFCVVHYSDGIRLKQTSPGVSRKDDPASAVPGTTAATTPAAPSATVTGDLPSLLTFAAGEGFVVKGYSEDSDEYILNYYAQDPDKLDVMQDYIDLLENSFGCTVVNNETSEVDNWYFEKWLLRHPNAGVASMDPYLHGEGNILIQFNQGDGEEAFYLTIQCRKELVHPDAAGLQPGPEDDPYKKCSHCGKTGHNNPCPTCGGNNWIDCSDCSTGRCRVCSP